MTLPVEDVELGAIRRIDDLQLLRSQDQKLRRRLVPRRFRKPHGAFAEIGRTARVTATGRKCDSPMNSAMNRLSGRSYRSLGFVDLPEAAVVDHCDAVRHGQRLALVVRDIDRGDAEPLVQVAHLDLHLLAQLLVERRSGSSMSRMRGSKTIARASATRCRWPPES